MNVSFCTEVFSLQWLHGSIILLFLSALSNFQFYPLVNFWFCLTFQLMYSIILPEGEVIHTAFLHHVLRKWALLFIPILPEGVSAFSLY